MQKILIANRGEIARRVIRAARGLGIRTAVVYSDADASALFVQEADQAVRLEGTSASDTYLVVDLVIEAALRVGADAVHPGYGFLSENADFAAACVEAGLTFIGPPPAAIRSMGDKVESKRIMAEHGVPVLSGITVTDDAGQDLHAALASIGLPAIIKASAGGGGRGMRIVEAAADLVLSIESAQREARAAFGDGTVFIERYISPARHIEVQVVADDHGQVAALFERECSIQRRHQKVVEEAPSPFVDEALRTQLVDAAIKAAKAVDYRGVGTVEFVVADDGTFAFLEMNTRLQVEHPVTEAVTGIDLVRLQLSVAAGEPLGPEVLSARLRGHAIEVRLCAEDPAAGYLPASGTFQLFEVDGPGIRVDTGVASGSEVSPFYDSMVAKVIAWGETRGAAAALLADALERARLHGVATNRDLLCRILRSEQFLAGDTTTDFVQRVPDLTKPRTTTGGHLQHAVAAVIAMQHRREGARLIHPAIPSGWRNNKSRLESVELKGEGDPIIVAYDLTGVEPEVEVNGNPCALDLHGVSADVVDATMGGIRRRFRVSLGGPEQPDVALVDSDLGASDFSVVDPLPQPGSSVPEGGLTAPMPGMVVRVLVSPGQPVEAGQPLLVLEAMKMEHPILSPYAGTVSVLNVSEGVQVERGAVLAEVVDASDLEPVATP
jgi:acetyl/propionyl-CoA carboxylase alpha subunit